MVSNARPRLSRGISHLTYQTAYTRFTPSNPNNACTLRITAAAGTELAGASSGGTVKHSRYCSTMHFFPPDRALQPEGLLHSRGVAGQGFPHCAIFPTAASRRSLGRVSVPVWLIILSDQLTIAALVGFYPTNKLMVRELILGQELS